MRTDPTYFILYLVELLPYFDDYLLQLPGKYPKLTREGAAAVEDGIEFLRR